MQVGAFTVAAEFKGHSVPTLDGTYSSEDYVAIEAAVFGPSGARIKLSPEDFTLRVNGKKNVLPSQPCELVFHSLEDPEWVPDEPQDSKSKTSFGGGGGQDDSKPPPPKMPQELRRAMEQRVQKVVLPMGDRPLPQAGLIFFEHRGKIDHIHSLELTYSGPAGKVTFAVHP